MAGNKIRGKQIIYNELLGAHLLTTGNTATNGQVPAYNAGSGGFIWTTLSADTIQSVSGATALSVLNPTGPNVVLNVNTDGSTIYVNGSNQLHLGDPSNNNLITGAQFGFSNDVTIYGNLTVNGSATTVNSTTVNIADNIIVLNSNFTAGTPTVNAGIEVRRGSESNVQFRWNETNDWWEVANPEGTGTTYSAILTTASVESDTDSSTQLGVDIRQGTGGNADKLFLSVSGDGTTILTSTGKLQVGTIQNTNLANSSVTVNAGSGLGGGGTVALGGSITLSATPTNDFYVTGGTASYPGPSNVGTLTLARQNGVVNISVEDTFVTGGTLSGSNIILSRNDGGTVTVDVSGLDVNDTYSTGGTVTTTPTNNSATGAITITGNAGFTPYVINNVNNTFTTGTSVNNGTGIITFYKNDGTNYNADLSGFDFNDTFVTGGTVSNGSLTLNRQDAVVNITGTILQSLTAQQGLTANTVNGAVTIGIQPSSVTNGMLQNSSITVVDDDVISASTSVSLGGTLNVGLLNNSVKETKLHVTGTTATNGQYLTYDAGSDGFAWVNLPAAATPSTPTILDKGLTPTATSGDNSYTNLNITSAQTNFSYVSVSVNGVLYEVGDGVITADCYFADSGSGSCDAISVRNFSTITAGDWLCWNGTISGLELDSGDRVDLYYNTQ